MNNQPTRKPGWKTLSEVVAKLFEPPEIIIGMYYYHKDQDSKDIVDHVIPQSTDQYGNKSVEGIVNYVKFYKLADMKPAWDSATTTEFQKWYRKGR